MIGLFCAGHAKSLERGNKMYSFDSRVRYSEVDENLDLTVAAMIDYLQDCSTFQSEDLGLGPGYLEERKRAWLLSFWQIRIGRMPVFGEQIRVSTWPYDFKGIYGYRNFMIQNMEGRSLVEANSVWFLYDTQNCRPVRIPMVYIEGYGTGREQKLELGDAPRKIPVPEEYEEAEPVPVARHHIDTNHHVNNAKYVEIAREALKQDIRIQELRVEYKKAAVLGDVVIPRITRADDTCTVVLGNREGQRYATVWMRTG